MITAADDIQALIAEAEGITRDAAAGEGDASDQQIPLCRIEYLGGDDWAFAIYDPATEAYENAILHNGHYTGSPSDAYDTAAIIHLADYQT